MHSFKCSSIVAVVSQVGVVAAATTGNRLISGITMTTTTSESGVSSPRLDEVFETTSTAEESTTAEAEAEKSDATSSEDSWFVPETWKIGPGIKNNTGCVLEMLAICGLCWLAMFILEVISQIVFGIGEVLYYAIAGSEAGLRGMKEKKKNKRNAQQDAKEDDEEARLLQ